MNRLKQVIERLFYLTQWQIGVGHGDIEDILKTGALPPIAWWRNRVSSIFNADPFPLGKNIVYERMNRWRGRAEIWIANTDGSDAKRWLKEPWHLSYPCAFNMDKNIFVVVESSAANRCVIRQLKGNEWVEVSRINEPLVDATPFFFAGRYWIFATLANGEENRSMHIWWSESIQGPWTPHKKNPVKVDPSSSRPAGNICLTSRGLVRPAQDCRSTYGGGIALCLIERLDENEYSETVLMRLGPIEPYVKGIHTLNVTGNTIIVDGKRDVLHPFAFLLKRLSSYGMKYMPARS